MRCWLYGQSPRTPPGVSVAVEEEEEEGEDEEEDEEESKFFEKNKTV